MYIPRKFALTADQTTDALRGAEFAHLVSQDPAGLLVTPLPLIYDEARHSFIGHVSRANPHWHADGAESVAIFSGPHTYISPSFYATKTETGPGAPETTKSTIASARSSLMPGILLPFACRARPN